MRVLVQRYMDDGYVNTHLIEEGTFDETLYNDMLSAHDDSEIYDALMEITPETDLDLYSIGNPNGYGNVVDEYRIYVDGELFKTVSVMRIDGITIGIYDDETDEQYEVILFPDSGDDIYPDIELSEEVQNKIDDIRSKF